MDPRQKMKFRRCLNSISNQLSRPNLEDMKFVCKDHVPISRMERVRSALDLFQALEERGKMSAEDTNFLAQVLVSVDRNNLISELEKAGFPPSVRPQPLQHPLTSSQPDGPTTEFLFNETLLKIAQHLSAKDVETLTFTFAEPLLQMSVDRIVSGTQLFQLLQQRQLVTPTNLKILFDELQEIGRSDLCKRINSYLEMTGQRPYDYDPEGAVGLMQPGDDHTLTRPTEESHPSYLQRRPESPPHYPSTLPPDHDRYTGHRASESGQPISSPSDAGTSATLVHSSGSYFSSLSTGLPSAASSTFTGRDTMETAEQDVYLGGGAVPGSTASRLPPNYRPPEPCSKFVPEQTYPIGPISGVSMEESGGSESSLQRGPFNLTFSPHEGELEDEESQQRLTRVEVQDLQSRWSQSQEQLQAVELEKQQLQAQLAQLQEQNDRIIAEKIGESEQYQVNNRELEAALQKKIEEVVSLQEEMQLIQQNLQPTRPVPDVNPDELYKLEKNPHGICLIINNHKFYHNQDPQKAHPQRGGAEIDQYNLTQTFRYLRYKVEVEENLTSDQMTDRLMKMSQRNHAHYDSFVCCILSHGEHNIIHGANSEPVNINDLTGIMKYCSTLRNKPKMFFIQCCRGEDEDVGFEKDNPGDGSSFRSTIPQEADFFLGFATPLGKAAYRSRKHGSWYISELCKVFTQYGYHSTLSSMMRRVNRQVSNAFTKDGYKQCTEFVDRLRREVHFFYFIRNRGKSS